MSAIFLPFALTPKNPGRNDSLEKHADLFVPTIAEMLDSRDSGLFDRRIQSCLISGLLTRKEFKHLCRTGIGMGDVRIVQIISPSVPVLVTFIPDND
jgi:hypothetical protein